MARMRRQQTGPSSRRLLLLLLLMLAFSSSLVYFFSLPMSKVYSAVYHRLSDIVSDDDMRQLLPAALSSDGNVAAADAINAAGTAKEERKLEEEIADIDSDNGNLAEKPAAVKAAAAAEKEGTSDLAKKHQLTKELAAKVAHNGKTIMVTWANYHYRDFVENHKQSMHMNSSCPALPCNGSPPLLGWPQWVAHLKESGCKSFIVGAMDDELLKFLLDKKVPTFSMSSGLTTGDFGWGTPTFHKMGREKINLIYTFTKMGFDTLISDVDTVWTRNPIPYVEQYPKADVLFSSDCLANTVDDEGLEKQGCWWAAGNIGIMLFRPSAVKLAEAWVEKLESDPHIWDQNAFNELRNLGGQEASQGLAEPQDRLFQAFNKELLMGVLPVALFCSGHTGFTQRMPQKLGLQQYVIHATFQYSGTEGKRHRMREFQLWDDGPEYFSHPGGFLSYDNDVPQAMLDEIVALNKDRKWNTIPLEKTVPHFNLVNHQLQQLRNQFALATILGRAAVLPALWSGLDRWWAPHGGEIPGSNHMDLPFLTEADFILDVAWMYHKQPEAVFGPHVDFREYSFLWNQAAKPLNASMVTIVVCKDASDSSCADGSKPADVSGGKIKLKPRLDDEQLAKALEKAKDFKRIHVEGMKDLFGGFKDEKKQAQHEKRAQHMGAIWCCVQPEKGPGHIWYDLLFDKIPHTDRHNRKYEKEWYPQLGP